MLGQISIWQLCYIFKSKWVIVFGQFMKSFEKDDNDHEGQNAKEPTPYLSCGVQGSQVLQAQERSLPRQSRDRRDC